MVIFILLIQPILVRIGTRHHDILYLTIFSYFSYFLTAWQIFFCFRSKWFSKRISRDGKRYFAIVDFFQFQHISYELINFYMSAQSSFHSWIVFLVSFALLYAVLCCSSLSQLYIHNAIFFCPFYAVLCCVILFFAVLCCPSLSQLDLLCAMFFCPFYVVLYYHKMPTIIVFLWNLISCGHHIQ